MPKSKKKKTEILIREQPPKQKRNDVLNQFSKNATSQSGEDGVISELFSIIDKFYAVSTAPRRVVEFGCWDGEHLSNSWSLVKKCGWRGVLMEADSAKFAALKRNYAHEIGTGKVQVLNSLVSFDSRFSSLRDIYGIELEATHSTRDIEADNGSDERVQCRSLNDILDELLPLAESQTGDDAIDNSADIDLLVVDIDGCDYHVLDSLLTEARRRPRVVCVEFNPSIANHIVYIQQRDVSTQRGSSLRALVRLCAHFHYELVSTTTYNAFFVDNLQLPKVVSFLEAEAIGRQSLAETTATGKWNALRRMHDTPMPTDLFQLYDGTLKIAGCKKLLWHKVGINPEQIQVLPKSKRRFPFAPTLSSSAKRETPPKKKRKVRIQKKPAKSVLLKPVCGGIQLLNSEALSRIPQHVAFASVFAFGFVSGVLIYKYMDKR